VQVHGLNAQHYPGGSTQPRRAGAQIENQHAASAKKTLPSGNVAATQTLSPHTPGTHAIAADCHIHAESNEPRDIPQSLCLRRDVSDEVERRARRRQKNSPPSAPGRQTRARASQGGDTTIKCECGTPCTKPEMVSLSLEISCFVSRKLTDCTAGMCLLRAAWTQGVLWLSRER